MIFALVCAGVLFSGCNSDKQGSELELVNWEMLQSEFYGINDLKDLSGWKKINLSKLFRLPDKSENGYRYVWLKSVFNIEDPELYKGVSLGRIYFVDKVYLNGQLIGSHFIEEMKALHYPRNYELPDGILNKGENEIQIYLGVYGNEFGGICGKPRLLSKELFIQQQICSALIFQQLPIGVMVFLSGMAVIILCMYLIGGGSDGKYLITLAILMIWFVHLFTIFSPYQIFNVDLRISILWTSTFLAAIFFFLGSQHYFGIYTKTLNRLYFPLLIGFSIITLVFNDSASSYYPGRIFGAINLVLVTGAHLFLLYRAGEKQRDKKVIVFWVMAFIPGLIIGVDIANYLWFLHFPPLFHVFTIPVISILLILFHTQRLRIVTVKMNAIPEPVIDIAPVTSPRLTVPVQLEDKLKRIIDFLGENYKSSVTREEIADREGLSPDYMSRMFKVYTGTKMNEYINELRIIDTGIQLRQTEKKIIDIAFSVGFVSLVTFNRAFSKYYNVSPRQYRDGNGQFKGSQMQTINQANLSEP